MTSSFNARPDHTRRRLLKTSLAGCAWLGLPGLSAAQQDAVPKQVRIVVPYTAGGASDTVARIVGQELQLRTGQTVVVENRPGASGLIAMDNVQKSVPDGSTLMLLSGANVLALAFQGKTFNMQSELTALGMLFTQKLVLVVNPQTPRTAAIRNVADLVAHAKAHPNTLNYASSSPGTMGHLLMERFKVTAGLQIAHIPYKGSPQAVTDLLGGQVDMFFADQTSTLPYIRAEKLRAIGVGGTSRIAALPDIPTFGEQNFPTIVPGIWAGVAAPARMPQEVANRIAADIKAIFELPAVQEKIRSSGNEPWYLPPQDMTAYVNRDFQTWNKFIKDNRITVD